MAQTILYYPTIDIRDGQWLRNAILYWDNVSSIVPYDNYPYFSSEISYLQYCGIYQPIFPRKLFLSEYEEEFTQTIIRRIQYYEKQLEKKSLNSLNLTRMHKNKIHAPILRQMLHCRKIPNELLQVFSEKKYIEDLNCDDWMMIDSKVAQIYMRTLAEYSIKCFDGDGDIVLGTDKATKQREIYSNAHPSLQSQCCCINITNCLPQPALDVSIDDILNFKQRRIDEFNQFKKVLREFEKNIHQSESIEEIKFHEESFKESWQTGIQDMRKIFKDANINLLLGSIGIVVGIPLVEELITNKYGVFVSDVMQNGASLITLGVNYLNYKNKINPNTVNSGFAYINKGVKDGIIVK